MARYPYHEAARDGNGVVISGATVVVYVANTTTPATIYATASGGSAITGATLTTDSNGRFNFWIDAADHAVTVFFDFVITGSSTLSMFSTTLEDIAIYRV